MFIVTNTSEWCVKKVQYGGSSSKVIECLATHVAKKRLTEGDNRHHSAFNPDYGSHFQYSHKQLNIFMVTKTSEWSVKTVQYGGSSSKVLGCLATHVGQCCQQETA
jgi:hypothetical protein